MKYIIDFLILYGSLLISKNILIICEKMKKKVKGIKYQKFIKN